MVHSAIDIRGAREHNLKGVDLTLPRDALITITGVSGSGKSSLAFDTLFREGQRRFLESLSSYARQYVGKLEKPKVESITGLSPTISIDQKSVSRNPRSTVGTITEVYDYLRLWYARLGTPHCVKCGRELRSQTADQIVATLLGEHPGARCQVLAPVVRQRKGHYRKELQQLSRKGFVRARIDGAIRRLDEKIELSRYQLHTIEVVVDRVVLEADKRGRVAEAVAAALTLVEGQVSFLIGDGHLEEHSTSLSCPTCGTSLPELEPRLFSFNSPYGACQGCNGLGSHRCIDPRKVVDPDRPLIDGGLRVMTRTGYLPYLRLNRASFEKVAAHFGFRVDDPWKKLSAAQKKVLLYGSGEERLELTFEYQSKHGNMRVRGRDHRPLRGLIPAMEAAFEETHPRHLEKYLSELECRDCDGRRLRAEARAVTYEGRAIDELASRTVEQLSEYFDQVKLRAHRALIGSGILREIRTRLDFLKNVGLDYLTLQRSAATLSGGEAQRVRLATQVGSGLQGVLYVLDEPSIGLHPRDQNRLLSTLSELRDRGNTVIVVEHDRDTMLASDHLVDVGPGAGRHGGEIVAEGPLPQFLRSAGSPTARYLRGESAMERPPARRTGNGKLLRIQGAAHFNLKDIDVDVPLGSLVGVTGVSGSGKSTLVHEIVFKQLDQMLHGSQAPAGRHRSILGVELLDKIIEISQSPIGRTPRSNPATYTKVWDLIRELYAATELSRARGYGKSRFSFNVAGGRCESCGGAGVRTIEMQFLADVEVECEECGGRRFNRETLEVRYADLSVCELLDKTVAEALAVFADIPKVRRILETLCKVGLDYISLGQPSTTLSGGEAQRIKLASELARPSTGRTLYILDEPTTGLHFEDVKKLVATLHELVDRGNSVLVIEHNLEVIDSCDFLIDLGPEGGERGGSLVCSGAPEAVMRCAASHTGRHLKEHRSPRRAVVSNHGAGRSASAAHTDLLRVAGARMNNLAGIDVEIPHDRLTVITGVSGSGKTSLALDTIFSEGQRRFVESLSTYARRFFSRLERPPVDRVDGIRPAIAIDQRATVRNPRSTVATTTEIYDHLRLLYARVGRPHCPHCRRALNVFSPSGAAHELVARDDGRKVVIAAPLFRTDSARVLMLAKAGELEDACPRLRSEGFARVLLDGVERRFEEIVPAELEKARAVDLVIDRLRAKAEQRTRIAEAFEEALRRGHGLAVARVEDGREHSFSSRIACEPCNYHRADDLTPRHFSFNHHLGACPACSGLGRARRCIESRVVVSPDRSLLKGALLDNPGIWFIRKGSLLRAGLDSVARHLGADLSAPFRSLTRAQKDGILRGVGVPERVSSMVTRSSKGRHREYTLELRWRGILGEIEHWLRNEDGSHRWAENLLALTEEGHCLQCQGGRLAPESLAVTLTDRSIHDVTRMTVAEARSFFERLELSKAEGEIAAQPLAEIRSRLRFLSDVGLDYLTLQRGSGTLSGGEAQRIRLAQQLGAGLVGVLYVLDEPSIGLHPRDTQRLIRTLEGLRDLGNTLLVVEHDEEMIRSADHVLDIGHGAGVNGGRLVAQGPVQAIIDHPESLTGAYLSGRIRIEPPPTRRAAEQQLTIKGATRHNLRDVDVRLPLKTLTVVTGVSGSGKSTLVMEVLREEVEARLEGRTGRSPHCRSIQGLDQLDQLIVIDQSPIGTTPSSNPATYTKVFDPIRELFAATLEARQRGFTKNRFSFNQGDGRCLACQGRGAVLVEMHFLSDLWVPCEACRGRRYNEETLAVRYKDKTIAEVLDLEVQQAVRFFENHPRVLRILRVLEDVGLGYVKLGQSSTTLSGGEAQRVKLASELARVSAGRTLYLLDEPTTGLHFSDIDKLVRVLHRLVDRGSSVVVIEHQIDVIFSADHVIDLGPEGGDLGGKVVATGTPEEVTRVRGSHTGAALARALERRTPAGSGAPA